ncbi:30S ribosomal protein S18 [Streptomonospora nanhaiensis]|uniref:Small ribosomal subunit protein bS18 n=1 Tax=Streptomonospora nanhaiensis TaxID=1323731 RepID=A0A853BVP0_9ACTN|nr:30S ribosomal protein S18 [Streptomonospora nanhaiensis]MBV2364503.1 30S ribosomal protein S18 [Streptomonospora nanhaiensis]MBX9388034.1 30S ribosomal protein S18 [Streptomonospora nanhaiensis]NYI99153.1 small subunit ribosomal protein S18 [Streptomonospora nanhaiensis]
MTSASGRSRGRRTPARFANPLGDADYVDYKDTDLLRRFISDRGKIRSRRVTRVTARQQRLLARAIKNAREMALLPYPSAPLPRGRS